MPALYLDAQGASLRKDGGEYVVHYKDTKQCFPQSQIERIILLGNIQLSTQVVADVLHHHIPVCFLSSKGQYRGRLTSTSHANVGLRLKQYDCIREDMLALPYARWFVIGKIRNAKELIGRKFNDMGLDSKPIRSRLKRWMDKAGRTHDMQRLRGFEGMAAREYFQCFTQVFAGSPFAWQGRSRRPPRDEINALLSLGYTLLLNECISAIESIGMDVYAGLLHGGTEHSDYGKPALALDTMEEFRYLVDRLVMRLLLSGMLMPADFEQTGQGGYRLSATARKTFFSAWEALMISPIQYDHRRLGYRLIIGEQANVLARSLQDESIDYRPFMP
ncbi:MAG: CRISPR-associated endonuclease Cas1 [Flavobacteriaceae bacterium]|nr:MAG: CRISPR-associated endonuclease Cas1 [Flavobacteriaceae bacterium]